MSTAPLREKIATVSAELHRLKPMHPSAAEEAAHTDARIAIIALLSYATLLEQRRHPIDHHTAAQQMRHLLGDPTR
jgi:hypothetical protein